MAVKVLSKTMDSTKLSSEKSEFAVPMACGRDTNTRLVEFATVGKTKDGKVYHHLWSGDEIMTLLKEHGLAKEEEQETE